MSNLSKTRYNVFAETDEYGFSNDQLIFEFLYWTIKCFSGGSRGGARETRSPLFLDQTEARSPPPPPPPPLSEGLDPPLCLDLSYTHTGASPGFSSLFDTKGKARRGGCVCKLWQRAFSSAD